MDTSIFVTIISAAAGIIVAALSFLFTKHREREADWRQQKIEHYKELMEAISGIVIQHSTPENQRRFADACNVVGLIASQNAVRKLQVFQETIKMSRAPITNEEHDKALTELVLALRKDLGLSKKDDASSFRYNLWCSGA